MGPAACILDIEPLRAAAWRVDSFRTHTWEFPKIRGTISSDPYNKDPTIRGTILNYS